MRGSPLLRAALMVAVLLLLIIPLRSFTAGRAAPPAPAVAPPTAEADVNLQIVSTAVPFTFAVSHLGRVIWQGTAAASPVETRVRLPFPREGVDLGLSAQWAAGGTAAVKLSLARGDEEPAAQTAWGDGRVDEIFTYR